MKRLLVYSHDTYGLGNIRRMLAICEHLCSIHADVSVLIVTGSPMLHAFRLTPRIDYVKLPCLTRTDDGGYAVKSLGLDYDSTLRMRREILQSAVEQFAPDLIIVDKKPFGVDEELRPALESARSSHRPPKLVLLLRDILDEPEVTARIWAKNRYHEAIETYFESVLVLGSPEIFDVADQYRFPPRAAAAVEYCGYLAGRPAQRSREELRAELGVADETPLVLVTPGGGEDGARITDSLLAILDKPGRTDFDTVIVTGPEMSPTAAGRVERAAADRTDLTMLAFTDDLPGYMGAADLVISMAGYNTVCEVLSSGRPAIAIPRVTPVKEQLIRATLMAELGLLRMIHPDELNADRLLREIACGLTGRQASAPAIDNRGLERVEKRLAGLIGDD